MVGYDSKFAATIRFSRAREDDGDHVYCESVVKDVPVHEWILQVKLEMDGVFAAIFAGANNITINCPLREAADKTVDGGIPRGDEAS